MRPSTGSWRLRASRPNNAAVALSLGLLRVRQHKTEEALQQLARATRLAPENAHYAYVYAVGLYSTGKTAAGLDLLRRTHERFPGNREVLLGLASLARGIRGRGRCAALCGEFRRHGPGRSARRGVARRN